MYATGAAHVLEGCSTPTHKCPLHQVVPQAFKDHSMRKRRRLSHHANSPAAVAAAAACPVVVAGPVLLLAPSLLSAAPAALPPAPHSRTWPGVRAAAGWCG